MTNKKHFGGKKRKKKREKKDKNMIFKIRPNWKLGMGSWVRPGFNKLNCIFNI